MVKVFKIAIYFIVIPIIYLLSCTKDYSYEGGNNGLRPYDTLPRPIINNTPSICPACIGQDSFIENKWSLYVGNNFYCGGVDRFIATPNKTGFTLYGPSTCSIDSGLVLTINLAGESLTHDLFNYTSSTNGFYYYDNVTPSFVAITQTGTPFFLTVESYNNTTKMLICSFYGTAKLANGGSVYVSGGKFKIKIS